MNRRTVAEPQAHPKLRASREGLPLEQVVRALNVESDEAFSRTTHAGAELNLPVLRGGKRFGFEFKSWDAPRTTKSMRAALHDPQLARLFVVYPGDKDYALDENLEGIQFAHVAQFGA
jgi:uncharacterized protein